MEGGSIHLVQQFFLGDLDTMHDWNTDQLEALKKVLKQIAKSPAKLRESLQESLLSVSNTFYNFEGDETPLQIDQELRNNTASYWFSKRAISTKVQEVGGNFLFGSSISHKYLPVRR